MTLPRNQDALLDDGPDRSTFADQIRAQVRRTALFASDEWVDQEVAQQLTRLSRDNGQYGQTPSGLFVPGASAASAIDPLFAAEVAQSARKKRVDQAAKRVVRAELTGNAGPPEPVLLSDLLNELRVPTKYRVQGLMPMSSRVILAAQYKAGKTTLTGNLIRSLVDGDPFLDAHAVEPVVGRVTLLDTEMSRDMVHEWLEDQAIIKAERVAIFPLRGSVSSLDILDPACCQEWVERLRALETEVLVFDCLRPLFDALGIDESHDAGLVLVALDEIVRQAGISELFVVHHMGHNGERSRGDSRLRDWPDVEWRVVRENLENPASCRFFTAYGRDVEVTESALEFDPDTRHLTLSGGSRKDASGGMGVDLLSTGPPASLLPAIGRVTDVLQKRKRVGDPPVSLSLLLREAGMKERAVRDAIEYLDGEGLVTVIPHGPGKKTTHEWAQDGPETSTELAENGQIPPPYLAEILARNGMLGDQQ